MARIGSSAVVTTLTAAALALVAVLALQAKSAAHETAAGKPSAGATAKASAHPKPTPKPIPVPAGSGTGKRVVYSLSAKRVWLVDPAQPTVVRTFTVQPSTVSPVTGTYLVDKALLGPYTGSDGVNVKNGVLFTQRSGAVIGFSSAVDGTTPPPDPAKRTGGIRESLGDGQALFDFAPVGAKVVVVA